MLVPFPRLLRFKSALAFRSFTELVDPLPPPSSSIRNASSPKQALRLYTNMHHLGVSIDSFTAVFALKACTSLLEFSLILQTHAHLIKTHLDTHVYVATALLSGYVCCDFDNARQLFDEMPERNAVTWNTMITGYSRKGHLKSARTIFDTMPLRDIASWSAMIAGYMANGRWNQGLAVFREMMMSGTLAPDAVMMATLVSGCSHMGSVHLLGKSIHAYAEKNILDLGKLKKSSLKDNVMLGTALVDLYAKCGVLNYAQRVFERMHEKNVMTWSAMISGLALHGYGSEALSVYEEMKAAGVRPNEITFTGILSACCHAGMVDEGRENFRSMTEEFGLEPRIQHYGCMVDLFGKAGLLEEAYELINAMKLEPNVVVWSSFLAACKMHRHFEMAERVIKQALRVANSDNGGGIYTLVSDLYALGGKWADVEQVREFMVNRNVKKARGSSFIGMELARPSSC